MTFFPISEKPNLNLTEEEVGDMTMPEIREEIEKYRSMYVVHRSKDKKADLVTKLLKLIKEEKNFLATRAKRTNQQSFAKPNDEFDDFIKESQTFDETDKG